MDIKIKENIDAVVYDVVETNKNYIIKLKNFLQMYLMHLSKT